MYWQKIVYRGILASGVLLALQTGFTQAAPITIEEQGSFTVGGSYKQHDGTWKQENFVSDPLDNDLMQEKNNREILELELKWLHEKGLDK